MNDNDKDFTDSKENEVCEDCDQSCSLAFLKSISCSVSALMSASLGTHAYLCSQPSKIC